MKKQIEIVYKWLQLTGNQFGNKEKLNLSIDLIDEEVKELKDANKEYNKFEIKDAIVDIFWVTLNNAYFNGISATELHDMFKSVFISNYSKFCKTLQEAENTIEAYKLGIHWDKMGEKIECIYELVKGLYVVKNAKTKKVMKSINYTPTNKL